MLQIRSQEDTPYLSILPFRAGCVTTNKTRLSTTSTLHISKNESLFRCLFTRGPFVDYIVLPIVYLHEGGHILCKGVAQGTKNMRSETNFSPPTSERYTEHSTEHRSIRNQVPRRRYSLKSKAIGQNGSH